MTYKVNYQIGYGNIDHSFLFSIYEEETPSNNGLYYVMVSSGTINTGLLTYIAGTLNAITIKAHQHTALEITGGIDSNKTYKIGSIRIA